MNSKDFQTLLQDLRDLDYNSYLCTTFALREDLAKISAVFLLRSELKRIASITNESLVGLIRLAWWRDNIEEVLVNNKSKDHHLLRAIALYRNDIDFELLKLVFAGFETDFDEAKKISNKEQLQDYIFKTCEVFFLVILKLLKCEEYNEIAGNLAKISFYFEVLKMIKKEDEKVTRFFYPDFFNELKINLKSWQKNGDEENLKLIVKYLCGKIEESSKAIDKIKAPKKLKNLILKKDLITIILQDLKKKDFDVFAADLSVKRLSVQAKLFFRAL